MTSNHTNAELMSETGFKYIKILEELRIRDKLLFEMKQCENAKLNFRNKPCTQCTEISRANSKLRSQIDTLKKRLSQFSKHTIINHQYVFLFVQL